MFPLLRCLLMPSPSLLLAPLNFKSAFSLQRIFRCQIFPCEDWQFGVLVFAVLFAWEMAWDSPIVNIVLQTTKTQLFMSALVIEFEIAFSRMLPRNKNAPWRQLLYDVMADTIRYMECFHMTSRRPYWCPKTMKRRPCWCPKPILWELNSFLMQTLSFVPINLHRCWPREWKHSI